MVRWLVLLLASVSCLAGCRLQPPSWSAAGMGAWSTYENESAGYRLRYPAACEVVERPGGEAVTFSLGGAPVLLVEWMSSEESRRRETWDGRTPTAQVSIGGRDGRMYVYDEVDGLFAVHTIALVAPHRERSLAFELRTDVDELDEIQQRVVDSVEWL